jgi:hypothetical protein
VFLPTDPEVRVRFPVLPDFLNSESGRGPLSLVSIIEELLERKSSVSGLESREYGSTKSSRWQRGNLYLHKLALTSTTSGGRSVGIVRSLAQCTELILFFILQGIRDSSVGIAADYGMDREDSIHRKSKWLFSTPQSQNRLWDPPSLLSNKLREPFPLGKAAGPWSWTLTSI